MSWRIVRNLGLSYETQLCFNVNNIQELPRWLTNTEREHEYARGWEPFEYVRSEDAAMGAAHFEGATLKYIEHTDDVQKRQPNVGSTTDGNGSDKELGKTNRSQEAAPKPKHHYLVRISTDIPLDAPLDLITNAIMGCEEVARHYLFEHTQTIELLGIRHD